ncbi:receptor-type tyrosine-protein phosphatase eta-like [Scomber japonicus]|uniref:receptor-type tyrosine-protein phosphatase eta-like n=1 Tax=Scomber japonicus TaxID=13676 RepID=UPI0023058163|nr:receptor-type tyrosine-protein phosphatase eta-like [Scomber japonicus]
MKPLLRLSVSVWALLVFSALLKDSRAACADGECDSNQTIIITTTTTTVEFQSNPNCSLSVSNISGNGSLVGLTPGAVYNISLDCLNCCKMVTTKPEQVINLSVTGISTTSISLSWNKPTGNISFYKVEWADGEKENVNETSKTITGLAAGENYTISVTAVADDGRTEGVTEDISQYTKPDVVKNLSVSEITTSSVSLTWTKPEGNSTFYRVQWTAGTYNLGVTVSETEMNVTSLTAGVQYTFTIIAVTGDNKTVGEAKTVSQYTKPDVVRNLSVSEITTSSVSLTWTKPEGNSPFYRVQWTAGTDNWGVTVNETEMNVTSLTAGVQYTFTIIAVAGDNETVGEAKTVSKYTKPEVVKSLSVSEITTSSVSLTWTKPEGNSTYYRVQWTAGTNNLGVTVNETKMNVTSLTAGVQYTFTITAVAGDNETVGEEKTVSQYTSKMCSASLSAFNIICCLDRCNLVVILQIT